LTFTFRVGYSARERKRWKDAFPEMVAVIDTMPKFEALPELCTTDFRRVVL